MKRKLPQQQQPPPSQQGYGQPAPPHMQQPKPQYPPPPHQQHGYPQGPPPPQQAHPSQYQQGPPPQQYQPQGGPPPPQHTQQHPPAQQQPPPQQQQLQNLRGETGICDLDTILASQNPSLAQWKKQGQDWTVVYNPKSITGRNKLDVGLLHSFEHGSVVCCVKFSNDGKYLATGCNRTAQIFDAHTGVKLHTFTGPETNPPTTGDLYVRFVCFSPDSQTLATGSEDKIIRIWDIATRTLRATLRGHEQDIYSMDWSRDSRFLVSGSGDRSVRVWDATSTDPNGKCLMILYSEIDNPNVQQAPAQQIRDQGVTSVAISPLDSRCVAAASLDQRIRVWDLRTGKLLERFEGHQDSVYSVAFSTDGTSIVSASLDKTCKVWDLSQKTLDILSRPPEHGVLPHAVPKSAHPSPQPVLSSARSRHTYGGHRNYVLSVAYPGVHAAFARSASGGVEDVEWMVSGSKDRSVTFWDVRSGAAGPGGDLASVAQFMLQGHRNSVISVAISPTEGLFATASGDCRARIWKITPLKQE